LSKKSKNIYDVSRKCIKIWVAEFSWAEMLKSDLGDTNHVKCIVRLTMKGKDVILGPKFDTLDKHVGKIRVVRNMPHLGKKEREFYVNKKCSHAKNEVTYFQ
jgi:hypothetical protein